MVAVPLSAGLLVALAVGAVPAPAGASTADAATEDVASRTPPAPTHLQVAGSYDDRGSSVIAQWREAWDLSGQNELVTAYRITWGDNTAEVPGWRNELVLTDLIDDTTYEVAVRAVTKSGVSDPVSMTFNSGHRPDAPSTFTSTTRWWQDLNDVTFKWSTPLDDGGWPIITYEVTTQDGTRLCITAGQECLRQMPRGNYTFQVRAINARGSSDPRSTDPVLITERPGDVTGLALVPGDGSLTATWQAPEDDGGGAVSYRITVFPVPGNFGRRFTTTDTSLTVTGLTNDEPYDVTVWAVTNGRDSVGGISALGTPKGPDVGLPPAAISPTPEPVPSPPVIPEPAPSTPTPPPADTPTPPPVTPTPPAATQTQPPAPAASRPKATVKVKATSRASKLHVDVNPDQGRKSWTFKVQKQQRNGTWKTVKTATTQGSKETRTLNLPKGTYRVVVQAAHGHRATTSTPVTLKR